jgi:predicted TIM-barrel fold metal-dependent hydrolase
MIIDAHTHIVPPEIKRNRENYLADPLFGQLYAFSKAKLATSEDLIASMDEDGIDMSVVLNIGWSNSELCRITNDYIMEAAGRYPRQLLGFGTVYLGDYKSAVKEVERCASGGLRGIGEMRFGPELLSEESTNRLAEFIKALTENKMTLLLHCSEPVGHQYQGKGDTTPGLIFQLIRRFPGLSLICAHWGGGLPFYTLMPEVKKALSGVLYDTAASPFLYSSKIYQQVIELAGAESILFGTDYPLLSQTRILKEIQGLSLPKKEEEQILSGNAQRYFGINTPNKKL